MRAGIDMTQPMRDPNTAMLIKASIKARVVLFGAHMTALVAIKPRAVKTAKVAGMPNMIAPSSTRLWLLNQWALVFSPAVAK